MSQADRCLACGADLSSGASLEGYCPKCLLVCALDDGDTDLSAHPQTVAPTQAVASPSVADPERVGPFRILERLGEGGMGEVFLAEQLEPVRRRVALKLIKPGMDSKQVMARFESERQALALMDHPAIAKVFDGGTTEQGRPYFAMEYIEGEPITRYCDRHRLDTRARLELFLRVCEGVQHAHQKGIIHRDIKPSNVLVTVRDNEAVPRIIDFGVAKATQQRLTERTVFTRLGVLIGTPEYMSPEQAEMTSLDIDTRTDVYSLGVLLYELLVGALPFDSEQLRVAGFDEIRRRIREDEPSKPSMRISTLGEESSTETARRRGVDPTTLRKQLRGDLDWITMRALEKDRTRRYGSPVELAADIRRHLTHEPVLAGPPSMGYRAKKFVRRHRVSVGAASVALSVLIAFAVTMTIQARRIASEAKKSARIAEFMTGVFDQSDPYRKKGDTVTAEQLLDSAAERIETELVDEPEVRGSLLNSIGWAYHGLGNYARAEQILRESSGIQRGILGPSHPDTMKTDWRLAVVLRRLNRLGEAEDLFRDTLEKQKTVLGQDHKDTLSTWNSLGLLVLRRGDRAEAAGIFEQVVTRQKRTLGPEDKATLVTMSNLALVYLGLDRLDEAESLTREVLEIQERVQGEDHPSTLESMHILGAALVTAGRLDEAEQVLQDAVERLSGVFPETHLARISTANDLAFVYLKQGRYAEAEAGFRKAYESYNDVVGPDHTRTILALHRIARAVFLDGRLDEAEKIGLEALERHREAAGDDHPNTLEMIESMAEIYNAMGDSERAKPYMDEFQAAKQ